jgi:hypothetical protein
MNARRPVEMRLLIVASITSIVGGVAAVQPALADPLGSSDVVSPVPVSIVHYRAERDARPRRAHHLPAAHDRVDAGLPDPGTSDVLPLPHAGYPTVKLAPETVHYERSPIGLDDSPTTFGLVAQF